jgi:hypothetical protein
VLRHVCSYAEISAYSVILGTYGANALFLGLCLVLFLPLSTFFTAAHEEIARLVRAQYAQYRSSDSPLARAVVQRVGTVEDAWRDCIWPGIRRKVIATLQAASREVTPRPCSFEFLGRLRLIAFDLLS